MPADSLGQTFRFIVEQAGGGGGGGGDGGTSGGGGGGAAAKSARQANEMRRMMDKMVKAVDTTEKTTQNAFTKGFKTLGLQLTFANMLKQSQVFTGTLNAIFQVVGALIDITLAPFMPLIVKFLQKAIPRLLDFAERMATWVRGELAQLDELGLVAYISQKLEEDIPKAFDKLGPIIASSINTITQIVVKAIPKTTSIAIKAMGEITAVVIGSAITEVGKLMSLSIGNVIKIIHDGLAGTMDFLAEKVPGMEGLADWADDLRSAGVEARDKMATLGEDVFTPMGELVEESIRNMFNWTADIIASDEVQSMFDALAESLGSLAESGVMGGVESLKSIIESLATVIKDNVELMKPDPEPAPPEPEPDGLTVTRDPTTRFVKDTYLDEYTGEKHGKATTDQRWKDAVRQRGIDAALAEAALAEEASSVSIGRIGGTDAAWDTDQMLKEQQWQDSVKQKELDAKLAKEASDADADIRDKAAKTAAWMAEIAGIQEGYTGTQTLPMHTGMGGSFTGGQFPGDARAAYYEGGGEFGKDMKGLITTKWDKPELMPGHKSFGKDPMRKGGSHPDAPPAGWNEWNPMTGWDLIPGNWQKGGGGIWDKLTGNKDRWQGDIKESANKWQGDISESANQWQGGLDQNQITQLELFNQAMTGDQLGFVDVHKILQTNVMGDKNLMGDYEVDINLTMNDVPIDVGLVADGKTSDNKKKKINADLGNSRSNWGAEESWSWGT